MPRESKNNSIKPSDALLQEDLAEAEAAEVEVEVVVVEEVAEDSQEDNKQVFQLLKPKE